MIKNIVFDFGGVIIDFDHARAIRTFEALGLTDAAKYLDCYHQKGVFQGLEMGTLSKEEFRQQFSELCGREISHDELLGAWLSFVNFPVKAERIEAIKQLKAEGYKIYILSNTNPYIMEWACGTEFIESGEGLHQLVDKIYKSCEMNAMKPSDEIYQMMLQDSGMVPSETLFVDDSTLNIEAGQKSGMHCLLAFNGESWTQQLREILAQQADK